MSPAVAGGPGGWWLPQLHPATRLAAGPLALATCLLVPGWSLPALLALLGLGLRQAGVPARAQWRAARGWWTLALFVIAIHAVTALDVAPFGHPTATGALRGVVALARAAGTVAALALLARAFTLGDLVAALAWWGLAGRGAGAVRAGVVLAVALGAAPGALAEGRRAMASLRLRRGAAAGAGRWRRWRDRARDAGRLMVPLLEGLFRRAEALTLSLRWRLPVPPRLGPPPALQVGALLLWTALLVALAVAGRRGA